MVCFNPQYIYLRKSYPIKKPDEEKLHQLNKPKWNYSKGYTQFQIPCGRCLGCRLDHANEWATRMYCELQEHKENECCFLTLTYNPKKVPLNKNGKMTLRKKDIQDFWKRLRKKYPELKIRYVVAGEYGPKNGRPHYHACVFGYRPKDLIIWKWQDGKNGKIPLYKSHELYHDGKKGIWGKGFVTIEDLNYNTACYTARYVQKKAGIKPEPIKWEWYEDENGKLKKKQVKTHKDKENEFIETSRRPGIGYEYWQNNKKLIKEMNGILVKTDDYKVKLKKIPRYFKKLWEQENWEEYHTKRYEYIKHAQETVQNLLNQISGDLNDNQKMKLINNRIMEKLNKNAKLLTRDRAETNPE